MKILDINWNGFLGSLAEWHSLPFDERRAFLRSGQADAGSPLEQHQPFARVMRALYANPVHEAPSRKTFDEYIDAHFTVNEKFAFGTPQAARSDIHPALFKKVISRNDWVWPFVTDATMEWESLYIAFGQRRYLPTLLVLKATQQIVELTAQDGPLAISKLPEQFRGVAPAVLAAAIQASLRYMLLFASIRGEDLEPVIGPWPIPAPQAERAREFSPVEARDVYHEAFLLEDMTEALSACITEPFRLRADSTLYAKAWKQIGTAMSVQPEWVTATFRIGREDRADVAVTFLQATKLADVRKAGGGERHITVSERGMAWLPRQAKERLKDLVHFFRTRVPGHHVTGSFSYHFLPYPVDWPSYMGQSPDIPKAVAAAFLDVPAGVFVALKNLLDRNSIERNPLAPLMGRRGFYSIRIGRHLLSKPDEEEIESVWHRLLSEFLIQRLLPLGGVAVGIGPEKEICFSVTRAGRYLLTGEGDFEYGAAEAAEVVVQPNFDVVFLSQATSAEAEISRFAERKGRKLGVLFHISKKSILSAANIGLTANNVMEVLTRVCAREVPANVEREIRGWFAACRRVETRNALLLECPDNETALRVLAAARGRVRALSETVLELKNTGERAALTKKLRDSGIFL
ncbi:MAG: hypothetical protein EXQ52_14530 [Bryobacterales bacterium]|nr:hypothetical protein [Bryobacterales bacterium]